MKYLGNKLPFLKNMWKQEVDFAFSGKKIYVKGKILKSESNATKKFYHR